MSTNWIFAVAARRAWPKRPAQRSLDPALIEARLIALAQNPAQETDWGLASAAELVDHILERYHEVHRQQLPELIRLALKVEQVHADSPDCPAGLADHLRTMQQELESHMQKEEQVLFPMLARGHGGMATMPIMVMRMEHDDHGVALERLLALTNKCDPAGAPPAIPGARCTWASASSRKTLMAHIHLENNTPVRKRRGAGGASPRLKGAWGKRKSGAGRPRCISQESQYEYR